MKPNEGSPHGFVNGGDVSRAVRRTSGDPTSSLPEDTLVYGYRGGAESTWPGPERRVEECACGSEIESVDDWRAIRYAVEVHNESTSHQQWRTWRE